jgi:SAM-dependent methyltransferase
VDKVPAVVAELGPGSSFGIGFAALICGAEKYYALDLLDCTDVDRNLQVFDELVALFRARAPIPATGVHSLRFPDLASYEFPEFLCLDTGPAFEARIAGIRRDIAANAGSFVKSVAPWTEHSLLAPDSVDWIFSTSVLEHVDDIASAYRAFAHWLKPGGYSSHLIDFDSHGTAQAWNGHWAMDKAAWFVLRGRRPYLLNRLPYSEHARLARENGFVTLTEMRNKRFDGLIAEEFTPSFRAISDEDARTRMVYWVSRLEPTGQLY